MDEYKESIAILKELQNHLKCDLCYVLYEEPHSFGNCDHYFCGACTVPHIGNGCPICKIPSDVKSVYVDSRLRLLASHCAELRELLLPLFGEDVTKEPLSVTTNDVTANETPRVPKVLRFSADTPDNDLEDKDYEFTPTPPGRKVLKRKISKLTKMRFITQKNKAWKVGEFKETLDKVDNTTATSDCDEKDATNKNDSNISVDEMVTTVQKQLAIAIPFLEEVDTWTPDTPSSSSFSCMRKTSVSKMPDVSGTEETKDRDITPTNTPDSKSTLNVSKTPSTGTKSKIDKRNAKGETPLQVAVIKRNTERVKQLLMDGATVNTADNAGWTPLHEACNHGFLEIAQDLINYGALVNVPALNYTTPLHDAVANNHLEIVKLLMNSGANPKITDARGCAAIAYAFNDKLKAALETFKTSTPIRKSTAEIQDVGSMGMIQIASTGLSKNEQEILTKWAEGLKEEVQLTNKVTDCATHLVSRADRSNSPRTLKYLQALLLGKWIVTFRWVEACMAAQMWISETEFEVQGTSSNPNTFSSQRARENAQQSFPRLLDGCKFYFHGKFTPPVPPKEVLVDLVKLGGGTLLTREPSVSDSKGLTPFHAQKCENLKRCSNFILYQPSNGIPKLKKTCDSVRALSVDWLLESIAKFELQDPDVKA